MKYPLGLLLFFTMHAAMADEILLRPHVGTGWLDRGHYEHAGMRFLLSANERQKYGLELTRINGVAGSYLATGIVLEQRLYGWFNMSIGSIAYFGQGQGNLNYPGVVANLGWEPDRKNGLHPFVTLRNDILFAGRTLTGTALSAGVSLEF